MYSASLNTRDKSSAIAAALLIQAMLVIAFLNLANRSDPADTQVPLPLVDFNVPRPPPQPVEQNSRKPRENGGSAARNIESRAAAFLAPRPLVETTPVNLVAASPTPRAERDPSEGASLVQGPGTGAGGDGIGNGKADGSGAGTGDGSGAAVEPPHLASPVLGGYDFPREILDRWPRAATVFLRLRIDARGYVAECLVDRGTNVPEIDSAMCNTAHERLRFRPAINRSGQAVAGWFGYAQPSPR